MLRPPPTSTLFPYTTLFRSLRHARRTRVFDSGQRWYVSQYACDRTVSRQAQAHLHGRHARNVQSPPIPILGRSNSRLRSEEHTSELQSRRDLVCRLLLEKKK